MWNLGIFYVVTFILFYDQYVDCIFQAYELINQHSGEWILDGIGKSIIYAIIFSAPVIIGYELYDYLDGYMNYLFIKMTDIPINRNVPQVINEVIDDYADYKTSHNLNDNVTTIHQFCQITKHNPQATFAFLASTLGLRRPKLIGICGPIASGKSTLAKYITLQNYTEYSFAKPLKEIAVSLGFENHQAWGSQSDKLEINSYWKISCREFLQKFGTEICRIELPKHIPQMSELWVKLFEKAYLEHKLGDYTVVSDIRFENEASMIRKLGGIVIKLERDQIEGVTHVSESNFDKIEHDYCISNDGRIIDLFMKFENLFGHI